MVVPPPIDIAQYTAAAPSVSVHRGISLITVMLQYVPEPASKAVAYRTEQMRKVRDESREAVRIRHREFGPSVVARHNALDALVDQLERIRDGRLGHWESFESDAVEQLAEQQRLSGEVGKVDWIALIDQARQAKRLRRLLFPNGVAHTRLNFEEQAEHMQTVADIIAEDGCRAALDILIGPAFMDAFDEGLVHYRAMIDARLAQQRGSEVNLRTVRLTLQSAIQSYTVAVLSMLRDDDPDSFAAVRRALRPIDAVRAQNQVERGRSQGQVVELSDPEVVQELIAAEQALEAELGVVDEGEQGEPPLIGA
jgi:hypothetical protein